MRNVLIVGCAVASLMFSAGCGTSMPSEGDAFTCPLSAEQASSIMKSPQTLQVGDPAFTKWSHELADPGTIAAGCGFGNDPKSSGLVIGKIKGDPKILQTYRDQDANEWERPLVEASDAADRYPGSETLAASDGGVWQVQMFQGLYSPSDTSNAVTSIVNIIRNQ